MRNLFRIYLEKPELAGVVLLIVLTIVFEFSSGGVFLSFENLRGVLGLSKVNYVAVKNSLAIVDPTLE